MAATANFFFAASRQYRSISRMSVWPVMDMISSALHPASANRRHAALRTPCGLEPSGKPASPAASLIQLENAFSLRARPYMVAMKAGPSFGQSAM
ncbi:MULTISPECIES: hypothetical protein [Bradyrhizobium]|uniref:hypothetical protein n=1 Tax=unclassified Bradyrhizobium TaxID=2631580 RepID=UPI000482A523|nr:MULTISPECIES: hypothetical protein [Bradyrhizobium]MDI2055620.1 hypothetical protein [Bradyrhizobium sp. Mp19]MDI2109543.1 hypothetical protein [Bradyrhizobium sp. Mp64]WLB04531.1 hypothetical protein QNJ80_22085 [Bradyrhizobium elkanii]WLC04010.1 hypothetical protein QIH86_23430 [Bradyrhizobium elkanii USDA 94]